MVDNGYSDIVEGAKPLGIIEERFLSDVYAHGKLVVQGIRSKLVYNEVRYTEPLLLLYPSSIEDFDAIHEHSELSVKGYFDDREIHVSKGYFIQGVPYPYGASQYEYVIKILLQEMYRTRYWEIESQEGKSYISFFVTDNRIFYRTLAVDFRKTAIAQALPKVILGIGDGWSATFKRYYSHIDAETEGVRGQLSTGHLVLELEKNKHRLSSIDEVQRTSELVTELLWYLAFASRQKTTWAKWRAMIATDDIQYYRRISVPERIPEYEHALIPGNSIQEFLQHCLEYSGDKSNLDLHLPIIYLVGSYSPAETLESRFISAFISLEALLNLYAESQNKTRYIGDRKVKKEFFSRIREQIEEFSGVDDKTRDAIMNRLSELNRVSFRTSYNGFCEEKGVFTTDLWSVCAHSKQHLSLYDIRNRLVHGRRFEYMSSLIMATYHLQWTVERCFLAVLGWNKPTNADPKFLNTYYPGYQNIPSRHILGD